jgi:nitrogen fixation NifU-like protein
VSVNNDIQQLYQEVILDHNRNPKNFRVMKDATHELDGHNPLCGDQYKIFVKVTSDKTIEEISFDGQGCAISKASTSMMTAFLKGKSLDEAKLVFDEFHELLKGDLDPENDEHQLGKLKIFSGIWKYPARVKCASLSWHTLNAILDGKKETVKTE